MRFAFPGEVRFTGDMSGVCERQPLCRTDRGSGQFFVGVEAHVPDQTCAQNEHDVQNHLSAEWKAGDDIDDRQDADDDRHAH